jgi:hypothetical protein
VAACGGRAEQVQALHIEASAELAKLLFGGGDAGVHADRF